MPLQGRLPSLPQGSERRAEMKSAEGERRSWTTVVRQQQHFVRPWESTLETSPAAGKFQQTLEEGGLQEPEPAIDNAPPLPTTHEVSELHNCMPRLKQDLRAKHQTFKAGQIKTRYQSWAKLTSDPDILQTVLGVKIQFESNPNTTAQS